MAGRNVNIYFQEKTYNKIKDLITQRKISKFINEAAEEKLTKEQKWPTEQELEKAYQEAWSNPQRMVEFKQWEKLSLTSWQTREKSEKESHSRRKSY